MAKVDVFNWSKEKVGSTQLEDTVFSSEVKANILQQVVEWQLASRRQGTHMTKTRGFVSGGGKKPFKQKGTGNARQGSSRSPLMPGGAKLFGPVPKDYSFSMPKKVRKLGLRMALSYLNKEGKLYVVESMKSEGKTKELADRLKKFGCKKAVLLDSEIDQLFQRASKNLSNYKYIPVKGLNVFDLLKLDGLILTKDSVSKIIERVGIEK